MCLTLSLTVHPDIVTKGNMYDIIWQQVQDHALYHAHSEKLKDYEAVCMDAMRTMCSMSHAQCFNHAVHRKKHTWTAAAHALERAQQLHDEAEHAYMQCAVAYMR